MDKAVMPPTTPTIDRAALLRDAAEIEAAGGLWKLEHVMAVLDCARSTVYNTPWLLKICKRVGKRGRRWVPADVRNHGPLPRIAERSERRTGS